MRSTTGRTVGIGIVTIVVCLAFPATSTGQASGDAMKRVTELLKKRDYRSAEPILRRVVTSSTDPYPKYLLGYCLMQRYDFIAAERLLREASDARPSEHGWSFALAKSLLEQGRNKASIDVLKTCIARSPLPEYHYARAMCHLNTGETSAAEKSLRLVLEKRPAHADALFKLGALLLDRGEFKEAIPHLRRCLKKRPDHVEARFRLGLATFKNGNHEAARRSFEKVVAKVPGHVGALYGLGRVLLKLGEREEGRRRLREFKKKSELEDRIHFLVGSIKLAPGDWKARLDAAELMIDAGRIADATTQVAAARRLRPQEPRVYRLLARIHELAGRKDEATRARSFAAELDKKKPR